MVIVSAATMLPFISLVQINNIFYAFCLILVFVSAIRLRYISAEVERPFRAAESNLSFILLTMWPMGISLYIIVITVVSDWILGVIAGGVIIFCIMCLFICEYRAEHFTRNEGFYEPTSTSIQ